MKKFILIVFSFFFLSANALKLKGGVVEEYIPEGFFGSWAVISKLESSNNPMYFNYESRDIWTLSGYDNVLILENLQSGAWGKIIVKEKSIDGKTLKFEREKIVNEKNKKIVYKEIVSFTLNDNKFSGYDNYIVEKHNKNNQIEKNFAKYIIKGVKISGDSPR